MRRFCFRFLIVFIPFFVYMSIYEYLYRTIPNTYSLKYEYLSNIDKAEKIKVLVLGTSHVFKGINPNVIKKKTFVAANDAQAVYYDAELLHHFLVDDYTLTGLKYVILSYDYVTLITGQTVNSLRESNYSLYWHLESLHNLPWYKNLKCLDPNLNIFRHFLNGESMIKCDSLGWCSTCIDTIERSKIKEDAIIASETLRYNEINKNQYEINKSQIKMMVKDCKLHNIKLILLDTPKTKDFYSRLDSVQLSIENNFADSLQKSNINIEYVNWQKNKEFDLNYFNDSHHLNYAGASKLGLKINNLLDSLDSVTERDLLCN